MLGKRQDNQSKLRGFSVEQLLEMINVVFQTTYIKYEGNLYEQVGGVPAGSGLSPFLCDGVLDNLDCKVNVHFSQVILKWFRYVDDTYAACAW